MNKRVTNNTAALKKEVRVELSVSASSEYTKLSYPVKYGTFSRLTTPHYIFEFNLNHEIRHARSLEKSWMHPQEWLKRTAGNDWVYYSTGGYAGVFEAIGEYYLPNLTYLTNSLLGGKPFREEPVEHIVSHWYDMIAAAAGAGHSPQIRAWFENVLSNTEQRLALKSGKLFEILGSRVSVMPPDARHVDYNIIPLHICDGCLYKCRFCRVKNKKGFSVRSRQAIDLQINALKKLYGPDIVNYNALFLGEHDALNAPEEVIIDSVLTASKAFDFAHGYMTNTFVFLFGSVDSLTAKKDAFFERLNCMPCHTFINIGLESCDKETLQRLGKPLTPLDIRQAFERIQHINGSFSNIEVTCNFVMDQSLPDSHYTAMTALLRDSVQRPSPKGTVYLSPLAFGQPSREMLYDFYRIKSVSRFPTFLYLIQRL